MNAVPRSVLVTGASGYLGRMVTQALAGKVDRLVAADVRPPADADRREGVIYRDADVRAPGLRQLLREHGVDTVVHLASIINPGLDRAFAYSVDVLGTRNLLDACIETGVKKLVVTSSGAAYGYHADNPALLSEDDRLRGNESFAYAHHKRLVEEMLAAERAEHPELGQLVFRPGTILGEGTRNAITALFDSKVIVGILGAPAPFVFIWDEDAVRCIVKGTLEGATGIFNLAGDGTMTMREIARAQHKPYLPLPAFVMRGALRALRALGATPYGPEQVDFIRYRPVLSNQRLKSGFGYTPARTTREVFQLFLESRLHE